jgi:hypothetical protein
MCRRMTVCAASQPALVSRVPLIYVMKTIAGQAWSVLVTVK